MNYLLHKEMYKKYKLQKLYVSLRILKTLENVFIFDMF